MRIDPTSAATAPARASATRQVPAQRTPVTVPQIRDAIARAHERLTGRQATAGVLDALTAQASLETARGASMFNFNFGGLKGASPAGATATYGTHEVVAGETIAVKAGFRAYGSIDEGATDYVATMRGRFGGALGAAASGDVDGFAHALKQAGYYTASERDYAAGLHAALGPAGARSAAPAVPALLSPSLPGAASGTFATTGDLARAIDALSLSAARIAAPSEEDV
jgi:flagellar protein FlgJ